MNRHERRAAAAQKGKLSTAGKPHALSSRGSITIVPSRLKNKADIDQARGLRAGACLWQMIAAAKAQIDGVNAYAIGLADAEAALEAWTTGGQHAFFRIWKERKRILAHRSGPSPVELELRRMILLMVEALQRTGYGPTEARKFAARELQHIKVLGKPSDRAIEGWQDEHPLELTPKDEQLLANGIALCGHQAPAKLALYFISLAHLVADPGVAVLFEGEDFL
jgi:hypothetical protein